ncbi:hypothetical protein OH738_04845 [Streptomyces hirsutus]|uniref:hypothetical protein n=1 Tax=Streptomyces hirsutus TaxID=35620 RepID=UPI0038695A91|nr:hypothetical protein OH738_04845 [Streptomyces hirsutus]
MSRWDACLVGQGRAVLPHRRPGARIRVGSDESPGGQGADDGAGSRPAAALPDVAWAGDVTLP